MSQSLPIKDKTQASEGLKIAPFKKDLRKTVAHKHNSYFEIVYLTKGSGTHSIDGTEYAIIPPILFNIRQEQVHHWNLNSEPEGFVLIIKKQFIENCIDKAVKIMIAKLSSITSYQTQDNSITLIFQLLVNEYDDYRPSKAPIIEGLIKALLGKLLESAEFSSTSTAKHTLFERFKALLGEEKNLQNKVVYYADLLNTSPQNLNTICRKEAKQSANEVLSEFIMNEAKRLLLYTDSPINEIAYSLHFKDNSHFTKYFKRQTGITPKQFRLSH